MRVVLNTKKSEPEIREILEKKGIKCTAVNLFVSHKGRKRMSMAALEVDQEIKKL